MKLNAISYARESQDQFVEDLISLVQIPSISVDSSYQEHVKAAADWNIKRLGEIGCESIKEFPVGDHQVVFGHLQSEATKPTVLIYGHYDVMPVDPIDNWDSDPFVAKIEDDYFYARGASDMKGQLIAMYSAIMSLKKTGESLPNIKLLLDGAEEAGSPGLEEFIKVHSDILECDFCLDIDGGILSANQPSITYGLRGIAYFELSVFGPKTNLHSGSFGGPVENPAIVLCELIAGMRDENGLITLPGFYESVLPISDVDRMEIAKMPTPDNWWIEQSGVNNLRTEEGYSSTELATARPTLNVNGILGGYVDAGQNTVIPASAMAKISFRLVPEQTPGDVLISINKYLTDNVPSTVAWEIKEFSGCLPAYMEKSTKEMNSAFQSLKDAWKKPPIFVREGGSVPIHGLVQEHLEVESLSLGFMLPDDNIHSSNERFYLPNFFRGIEAYIRFLHSIGSND